jgi:hypothetical protein
LLVVEEAEQEVELVEVEQVVIEQLLVLVYPLVQ